MKIAKQFLTVITTAALAVSAVLLPASQVQAATPIFESQDYAVLTNIIGAVESGGQVYGQRNYAAYAAAYQSSPKEYTCTLGWAQYYGNEAQTLIQRIYQADPETFRRIDSKQLIQNQLGVNWVNAKWNPNAEEKAVLIQLITTETGKKLQDAYFQEQISAFVRECAATYTNNIQATMMYCEIRHLGGKNPTQRIFGRLNGNYSVDNILASLKKDQEDTSNQNQVGDARYWSRHEKCANWVKRYARTVGESISNASELPSVSADGQKLVYRLYNANTGEHFYTTSPTEVENLQRAGWKYEQVGWTAPASSTAPVYRLYNPNSGEHHFTINAEERQMLISSGWRDEGTAFYSDTNRTRTIYREYNPNQKAFNHNYASSKAEHDYLISIGWKNEGNAWYAVA